MTKLYDNRLAEERIGSLEDLEVRLLGTNTKKTLKVKLEAKYGKSFYGHPDIVSDPDFQEYGINDTRITRLLYDKLKNYVPPSLFNNMQKLQDKLAR